MTLGDIFGYLSEAFAKVLGAVGSGRIADIAVTDLLVVLVSGLALLACLRFMLARGRSLVRLASLAAWKARLPARHLQVMARSGNLLDRIAVGGILFLALLASWRVASFWLG